VISDQGLRRCLREALLCGSALIALSTGTARAQEAAPPPAQAETPATSEAMPEQVIVTGARTELLGVAQTSSQGIVLPQEIQQLPSLRPGQLLETVPGLTVTIHSGEGKANQYLLRGFNLDHGTDIASFIDGIPVNLRTHAHGQGYADLNFFIPELSAGLEYTKGPYFAEQGDFSSVASVHLLYANTVPDQVSATGGSFNYERLFGAGTQEFGTAHVLGALELVHYDGPWTHGDDYRKLNAVLRYSEGEAHEGYSVTGMYYRGLWNATTDQPLRAMDPAYMASLSLPPIARFGTLDPSDAGQTQRMSLSGVYSHGTLDWHLDANAYVVNSNLTLWNNFSHFLDDPVHGDQEAQNDIRTFFGGGVTYAQYPMLLGSNVEILTGLQGRYDDIHVYRLHTENRTPFAVAEDDRVSEGNVAAYGQLTNYWTEWFRTVIGVREDYFSASDRGTNAVKADQTVFQPKGSIVVTPIEDYELYVSAGRGFHSNDVRGIATGGDFLTSSEGEEIGLRATPFQQLHITVTLFQMTFKSELTYDPDVGQTSAGPPSRRTGVEINPTYAPFEWLEFYGSVALTHARFSEPFDDGTGHVGRYIPDAPSVIGNLGIYVHNLGQWFGAVEFRYLGEHPLTPDDVIKSSGDKEWNMNVGYDFGAGIKAQLEIVNVLDSKDDAAEYWYADRLPGEPAEGVADLHIHPLEPRSFRFTLSKTF
jgi:hypothetical protein